MFDKPKMLRAFIILTALRHGQVIAFTPPAGQSFITSSRGMQGGDMDTVATTTMPIYIDVEKLVLWSSKLVGASMLVGTLFWGCAAEALPKDISGMDLSGQDLSQQDFTGVVARKTNFRNANLEGSSFAKASLENADFTGANVRSASFVDAVLDGASFKEALAEKATFSSTILDVGDFENVDLTDSMWPSKSLAVVARKMEGISGELYGLYQCVAKDPSRILSLMLISNVR
jgi:hypothetical protein